ncbi:hypothetical protein UY3_12266 [Chelonia mydas]|uniref:Uncharacterized protein n=1 Tax=Chelonia mydas TaxID=8469 RepID=M7AYJ9_CHEMY|nr:hypothetical protein UY3_12266 [Chelonia mydas]
MKAGDSGEKTFLRTCGIQERGLNLYFSCGELAISVELPIRGNLQVQFSQQLASVINHIQVKVTDSWTLDLGEKVPCALPHYANLAPRYKTEVTVMKEYETHVNEGRVKLSQGMLV